MKVSALFKIILKEYRRNIFISILLLAFVDFVYANFTGVEPGRENGLILWQGGNDIHFFGLNTVLLKLSNVSILFITVGKIADKISGDIMVYILARVTDYRKFICAYSMVLIMLGEALLTVSHIVYYCVAGFYLEQVASGLFYLLMDGLGFGGMAIIYIILNNCYSLENSFLYIIAAYVLNTVLPVPILPAMSTVRFFVLKSQITEAALLLSIIGIDLIVAIYYYMLIKRKRVNVC